VLAERVVIPRPSSPCPAASVVAEAAGGSGCHCLITGDLIDSRHNPSSLAAFCFNTPGYQSCPSWRKDRETMIAQRTLRPLLNARGDLSAGHPEDKERDDGLALALDAQERDRWERRRARER